MLIFVVINMFVYKLAVVTRISTVLAYLYNILTDDNKIDVTAAVVGHQIFEHGVRIGN